MVVKQSKEISRKSEAFESSVISYGSQTWHGNPYVIRSFESSVISYGSQTCVSGKLLVSVK